MGVELSSVPISSSFLSLDSSPIQSLNLSPASTTRVFTSSESNYISRSIIAYIVLLVAVVVVGFWAVRTAGMRAAITQVRVANFVALTSANCVAFVGTLVDSVQILSFAWVALSLSVEDDSFRALTAISTVTMVTPGSWFRGVVIAAIVLTAVWFILVSFPMVIERKSPVSIECLNCSFKFWTQVPPGTFIRSACYLSAVWCRCTSHACRHCRSPQCASM